MRLKIYCYFVAIQTIYEIYQLYGHIEIQPVHVGFNFGIEMQFFGNFWSIPIVLIRKWYFPDYPTPKHFIFDVYRLIMTLTTKQWADLNRKKGKPEKKERTMLLHTTKTKSKFLLSGYIIVCRCLPASHLQP